MFERPALANHVWYDELQEHRLDIVDSIRDLQDELESPNFNPSIHFWASDQGDRFLDVHQHQKMSCLVWHDSAGPVIQPSTVISHDDETAFTYTRRMSTNLLDAVRRQQGAPLDIVAVVMRRGAEYVANLNGFAGKTAHNVVWVSLADVDRKTEQSVLTEVFDMLLRQLGPAAGRPDLGAAVAELQDIVHTKVTCGLVRRKGQPAPLLTVSQYVAGKPQIEDHIANSGSTAGRSFQQRWNWLQKGNPDPDMPAERFTLTDDTTDVSHFQSIAALCGDVKKTLKDGLAPGCCGKPVVIGVMPDWQHGTGYDGAGNIGFTRAIIQQAAISICEDCKLFANAVVVRQVVIVDPEDEEGMVAKLLLHTTPVGDRDPVWANQDWGKVPVNTKPKGKRKSSSPVVVWLDVRDQHSKPVEVPTLVLTKVLCPVAAGAQKKKGNSDQVRGTPVHVALPPYTTCDSDGTVWFPR